jgi:hypothetical protein
MQSIIQQIKNKVNPSEQQLKRIEKVFNEEYYVLDHSEEENKINIFISGSTKSVYTISINKSDGKLWCDCPDSKSHAARHNCMCKHCCFTIIKIGKLYLTDNTNDQIWSTKCMSSSDIESILKRLNRTSTQLTSTSSSINEEVEEEDISELINDELKKLYISKKNKGTETVSTDVKVETVSKILTTFDKNDVKELTEDDECPICYDFLLHTDVKSCPTCHNYIHTACIQKWLTTKVNCVLCRSTAWSTYFKEHSKAENKSKVEKNKNSDYLQL